MLGTPAVVEPLTIAVGAELATAEPDLLDPVTCDRRVKPTSALVTIYAEVLAPEMGVQALPAWSQRFRA